MNKRSKLPNGFGCIKRLSGNRRNPYAAYPSSKSSGILPALNSTQAIGYYEDWYAAYNALVDYNQNLQYSITPIATFADVYHAFYKAKFVDSKKQLADRSRTDYVTAFKNVPSLHELPFCSIRKADMQKALDECPLGYSSLSNIKKLYSQIYKYALENDIIEKIRTVCQHLLMGHSLGNDVEKAVYGHRTLEELRREINKIDSDTLLASVANGNHRRTSTGFTCTEPRYEIEEQIKAYTPGYAHLVSVNPTDYVGNHFKAVFTSVNPLSKDDVDQWVERALSKYESFRFD